MDGAEASMNINIQLFLRTKIACQSIRGGECDTMPCCARDTGGHKIERMEIGGKFGCICAACLMNDCRNEPPHDRKRRSSLSNLTISL